MKPAKMADELYRVSRLPSGFLETYRSGIEEIVGQRAVIPYKGRQARMYTIRQLRSDGRVREEAKYWCNKNAEELMPAVRENAQTPETLAAVLLYEMYLKLDRRLPKSDVARVKNMISVGMDILANLSPEYQDKIRSARDEYGREASRARRLNLPQREREMRYRRIRQKFPGVFRDLIATVHDDIPLAAVAELISADAASPVTEEMLAHETRTWKISRNNHLTADQLYQLMFVITSRHYTGPLASRR